MTSAPVTGTGAPALPALPGSWVLAARAFQCWLLAYRRTWRSSVWSSVFGPLFYLGAMGYGLGSLVDKNGTSALGGVRETRDFEDGARRACRDLHLPRAQTEPPRPLAAAEHVAWREGRDVEAALAEANGLKVVMNRCPKIEYGRLSSEISWMGVNSRTARAAVS